MSIHTGIHLLLLDSHRGTLQQLRTLSCSLWHEPHSAACADTEPTPAVLTDLCRCGEEEVGAVDAALELGLGQERAHLLARIVGWWARGSRGSGRRGSAYSRSVEGNDEPIFLRELSAGGQGRAGEAGQQVSSK